MYRATTPQQIFNLKTDAASLAKILITFTQGDEIVIEKTKEQLSIDGTVVSFRFTQEETKKFDANKAVYIQVRFKDAEGNVSASKKIAAQVEDVLNDEVL